MLGRHVPMPFGHIRTVAPAGREPRSGYNDLHAASSGPKPDGSLSTLYPVKSEWRDLNTRPLRPERSALAKLSYTQVELQGFEPWTFCMPCRCCYQTELQPRGECGNRIRRRNRARVPSHLGVTPQGRQAYHFGRAPMALAVRQEHGAGEFLPADPQAFPAGASRTAEVVTICGAGVAPASPPHMAALSLENQPRPQRIPAVRADLHSNVSRVASDFNAASDLPVRAEAFLLYRAAPGAGWWRW